MTLPKTVTLTEVSPRDGLQNEPGFIPTENKIQFIALLTEAGFSQIETTSFVNPKKIPALADHAEVMKKFSSTPHTKYFALVPNLQGLKNAMQCGCKYIAVFTTASETFSQKNTNCSVEESFKRINEVIAEAKKHAIFIRGYISCVMGCPYEGFIPVEKTAELANRLFEIGCDEIALGDTIGTGNPLLAQQLIQAVSAHIPLDKIAIHFHDTYGQALVNIYACLQLGISKIDASVGGLGGCPYAKGAAGNVATEKVLYLLNNLTIKTGVDIEKVKAATAYIKKGNQGN
ncbi:MAG: hydroxymethylglutaryl-CoA lyase [Gammaproteobacteria bacterium RIFCSPHIGHO2_12_FULL_42_13]|nr:MAG: hydroxymethylglutaryl-CoA lyase [Gammaproteobacteria bacterium RIFCSPHIGHO2_12_FULL_42_13]